MLHVVASLFKRLGMQDTCGAAYTLRTQLLVALSKIEVRALHANF